MPEAFVNGSAVLFERAVFDAARMLARARLPLICGLDADAAAIRAAVKLAERVGGVIDHAASADTLKLIDVLRSGGGLVGSPEELKRLATMVLAIGRADTSGFPAAAIKRIRSADALPALRAAVKANDLKNTLGQSLLAAAYGVVLWNAADLDGPETEMAMGLVKDLNAATRFSALPLSGASGVDTILGWMTGFPARTSLARGFAGHDPWTHSASRLIASGEADVALWVSASEKDMPGPLPVISIAPSAAKARIAFPCGTPGIDHDSAEMSTATGTFVNHPASAPSAKRGAAAILTAIMEALP